MAKKYYIIVGIVVILITVLIIKIQFFPLEYKAEKLTDDASGLERYLISNNLFNTSIYSYKVDIKIHNKDEFISFLKANPARYELGSYMDSSGSVDWQRVFDSIKINRLGWKRVYLLEYEALNPDCNGYKLEMTSDGYIRDFRSDGK